MDKIISLNGKISLLIFISFLFSSCMQNNNVQTNIIPKNDISYIDGPYVFHENGKLRIINVNQYDQVVERITDSIDSLLVKIPTQNPDHFYVSLNHNIITTPSFYEKPDKLFAVSDIEGNYYAFVNLLIGNKVVDNKLNWTFGTGHLVLNGDFVDRGEYVTQVLWLIYKLEQEASAAGGHVHFILGNHETMNLEGNFRYVVCKYRHLAKTLAIPHEDFYNDNNELGHWMRSKNIAEKIGDILFVHGGISPQILDKKVQLADMNRIAQSAYGLDLDSDTLIMPDLLFGRYGPLWYRGLIKDYKYYPKTTTTDVNKFLEFYGVGKVVIGHSIVDDISTGYNGKVVQIDLHHPMDKTSTKISKALLIENGILFKVDDKGNKIEIE